MMRHTFECSLSQLIRRPFMALAAVIIAVALLPAPASAQFDTLSRHMQDLTLPKIVRRDLAYIVNELDLDDEQRVVVEAMYENYAEQQSARTERINEVRRETMTQFRERVSGVDAEAYREQTRELREKMRELRNQLREEGADREAIREKMREEMGKIREKMREMRGGEGAADPFNEMMTGIAKGMLPYFTQWQQEQDAEYRQFLADVQSTLVDEQIERWPDFQRAWNRYKLLDAQRESSRARLGTSMSGESVDLTRLVSLDDLDTESKAEVEKLVEMYEIDMDISLQQREATLSTTPIRMLQVIASGNSEGTLAVVDEEIGARAAVRDVNDSYLNLMTSEMSEDAASELTDKYRKLAFPSIFDRPSFGDRAFSAALRIEELDESTIEDIESLRDSYDAEIEPMHIQHMQAVRNYDPIRMKRQAERLVSRMTGQASERQPDPTREVRRQIAEVEDRYVEQLRGLLTPEQAEQLPRRRSRFGRDGRGRDDRPEWQRPNRDMMERFDKDGDGDISFEERREAIEYFRQRAREQQEQD